MSLYFLHETCYWLWIIITLHIIIHAYAFFMNKRRITEKNFEKEKKKFMLDTELGQLLFLNYTFLRALE